VRLATVSLTLHLVTDAPLARGFFFGEITA